MDPHDAALLNVADYAREATRRLPPGVATYVNAGNLDGHTAARNEAAFAALGLRAFRFVDVRERSLATTVLGRPVALPVLIAPTGLHGLAHPDGELATARAAAQVGTVMATGTMATYSIEEVAAEGASPRWFQLYHVGHDVLESLVRRAETAGYDALVLTVDVPLLLRAREHDRRNAFMPGRGLRLANFEAPAADPAWRRRELQPVTLEDLTWLRGLTELPLVVKGILTAEDARHCVEAGVDGVIVSNHGGRECDGLPASMEVLTEVVEAVNGHVECYLDGGVRRGSDVAKALCLGARAVLIGRPFWWGLAVAGEHGVRDVLELLRAELDEVLIGIGGTDVAELGPRFIANPGKELYR